MKKIKNRKLYEWLGRAVFEVALSISKSGGKKLGEGKSTFLLWLVEIEDGGGKLGRSNRKLAEESGHALVTVSDTVKILVVAGLLEKKDDAYALTGV